MYAGKLETIPMIAYANFVITEMNAVVMRIVIEWFKTYHIGKTALVKIECGFPVYENILLFGSFWRQKELGVWGQSPHKKIFFCNIFCRTAVRAVLRIIGSLPFGRFVREDSRSTHRNSRRAESASRSVYRDRPIHSSCKYAGCNWAPPQAASGSCPDPPVNFGFFRTFWSSFHKILFIFYDRTFCSIDF